MVSITARSAPAAAPAMAISRKYAYACSKRSVPIGSRSSPSGPMSSATAASGPAASLATATAAGTTSATVCPEPRSFGALAPNVLA